MSLFLSAVLLAQLSGSALPVSAVAETVTFADHIAPILFGNCTECHRPGEAAPFSLQTFADAKKRARTLLRVVESGYMPPWKPVSGHGDFRGERQLDKAEVQLLQRWVAGGMPEGDPSKTPALPEFTVGWRLGTPDIIVTMERAFQVPASGPDIYRNFCLPLDLPSDSWVTGIEVRPSARTVVHHVLFFQDTSGQARRSEASDPEPGYSGMGGGRGGSLGGWAVGGDPYGLPGGLAMPLPAGADLVLQTHFHPSGKAEMEQTTVGIYLADEPPAKRIVGLQLPPSYAAFAGLDVAPGESAFTLRESFELPVDTDLVTVAGHAHYIARKLKAWAVLPDGSERNLFLIDDWDFNWQGRYIYKEPVRLPAGTKIEVELIYDNSDDNPRNPFSPPRRITWGLESEDEMGAITWITTAVDQKDTDTLRSAIRNKNREARRSGKYVQVDWFGRLMKLDKNGDGKLTKEEASETYWAGLARMDRNGDGVLDEKELETVKRFAGRLGGGRGR